MPRTITKHKSQQILGMPSERVNALCDWLFINIEDTISARKALEAEWRSCLTMYQGVPKEAYREIPIENAPNLEITIGAIAADDIYAQAMDLIFNTTPLVTVRPKPKAADDIEAVEHAKALQRFTNHVASSESNIYQVAKHSLADDVQLGTMVTYTPFIERVVKTKTASVRAAHPVVRAVPPEDWIIFENNKTVQEANGTGVRFYYSESELSTSAARNTWNTDHCVPLGAKDWVRTQREALGKQVEGVERIGKIYEIWLMYVLFDIDGDGIDEDLFVVWNHQGRHALWVGFSPVDHRPLETAVYQVRPHLPYGLGVLEMMKPYEEELTDIHNYQLLNALLANARVWVGKGVASTMKIWPGKVINLESEIDDLQSLQMADVYPSLWQFQMMVTTLANKRVGMSELSAPSSMPSRTPGITALSMLQQVNRRFTPAFNDMRFCLAGSIKQCLYRYQEKLLSNYNGPVAAHFDRILGPEDGIKVSTLLRDENFDDWFDVEITAASASVNREADRQNAIILVNTLGQYYQRMLELTMVASNPQVPAEVREVAKKVSIAASESVDRALRTFDQVRDPGTFLISVEDEMNQAQANMPQQAMARLMGMLLGGGGVGGPAGEEPLQLPYEQAERMMG